MFYGVYKSDTPSKWTGPVRLGFYGNHVTNDFFSRPEFFFVSESAEVVIFDFQSENDACRNNLYHYDKSDQNML